MKAKYFFVLLLIGMFAVGGPVGAVAEEWFEEAYSINPPLETGALIPSDNPSDRSMEKVRHDPEWVPYPNQGREKGSFPFSLFLVIPNKINGETPPQLYPGKWIEIGVLSRNKPEKLD
jgi:hypothetical protein